MSGQLFLFEVLIDNIFFEEIVHDVPPKKKIVVSVKLGSITTLEIRSETLPTGGEGSNKRNIEFKSGKSYLCSISNEELLEIIEDQPLEVTVAVRGDVQPIGSCTAPWDNSFREVVLMSKDPNDLQAPAAITDNFCLMQGGTIKGNLNMVLKLSCFGKNIQTHFEILQESGKKQFIFKMHDVVTTFVCSRYGAGTSNDFIPINALFNGVNIRNEIYDKSASAPPKSISWTALMQERSSSAYHRSSLQSEFLFPEYLNIPTLVKESAITFDIQSLRGRADDEKFLDFITGKKLTDLDENSIRSMSFAENESSIRAICEKTFICSFEHNSSSNQRSDERMKNTSEQVFDIPRKRVVLRLRGGGTLGDQFDSVRLRGGAPSKSPIVECQEVMDQFDKVLEEYKKALAPCGQISCSHVPNVVEEACRTTCNLKPERGPSTSGCGLPQCQYARYKSGLFPIDADIEKQFIGPAIIGNCGHPKCTYKSEPTLPPIHWECPDPLPTGKCKNPNCPYPPPKLEEKTILSATKGPCGNELCPFAPPAPCSSPNCPFRNPPACYHDKQAEIAKDEAKTKTQQSYAKCPFTNPPTIVNMMQICDNPNCEKLGVVSSGDCGTKKQMCNSPNCPYRILNKQCSNPKCPFVQSELMGVCSYPNCPLKGKSEESCKNPSCPSAKKPSQSASRACSNPKCAYDKSLDSCAKSVSTLNLTSPVSSTCLNPDCPMRTASKEERDLKKLEKMKKPPKEACANPLCPFHVPSVESCKNPLCPFKKKDSKESEESKESCDNPECPYKGVSKFSGESDDSECFCENPLCPSRKDTCMNPSCPFNLRGYGPCTNPECPHKKYAFGKDLGFCATPDPSFNEFCADKSCPFHNKKTETIQLKITTDSKAMLVTERGNITVEEGPLEKRSGMRPSVYDMAPCSLKTCKYLGGKLTCVDCGIGTDGRKRGPCPKTCPGDPICPLATAKQRKKAPRRQEPTFKITCGKRLRLAEYGVHAYPGYKIGHRECVLPYFFVPKRMGWLWNIYTPCLNLKPRRGWRPGAITKSVARAILRHRRAQLLNPQEEKKKKKKKNDDDSEPEMICPKPTLEIKKREGKYFITMNPLKDPGTLKMNENPYIDCTPMKFTVAKDNLDDPDCICTDRGELYKLDSSSDSEIDIEVTTPAGIIHPDRPVHKKDVKVRETQYNPKDLPQVSESKETKEKKTRSKSKGKDSDSKRGKDAAKKKKGKK